MARKGYSSWGDAPTDRRERWDQNLIRLDLPKADGKPKEIRAVGGLFCYAMHFIPIVSKRTGKDVNIPVICPDWDLENQQHIEEKDKCCPICRDFGWSIPGGEEWKHLRMGQSFRYIFHAFDISALKAGATDEYFGAVLINRYGYDAVMEISKITGTFVDDLSQGVTLYWSRKDVQDAKQKESFQKGDKLSVQLKPGEDDIFGIQGPDGTRYVGEIQDLVAIIPVPSGEEVHKQLTEFGMYKQLQAAHRSAASEGGGSFQQQQQQQQQAPPQQQQTPTESWDGGGPPNSSLPESSNSPESWDTQKSDGGNSGSQQTADESWSGGGAEAPTITEQSSDDSSDDSWDVGGGSTGDSGDSTGGDAFDGDAFSDDTSW